MDQRPAIDPTAPSGPAAPLVRSPELSASVVEPVHARLDCYRRRSKRPLPRHRPLNFIYFRRFAAIPSGLPPSADGSA